MTALKAPARAPKIQFSHFGINVRDLDLMEDFYTRVVGFTVTDRGAVESLGISLVFMSMDPVEHHQFVICTGDPELLGSNPTGAFFAGPINRCRSASNRSTICASCTTACTTRSAKRS